MRVGIDFDNTLAAYDALFHALALERSLVGPDVPADKRSVRDAVRARPGGEAAWQGLQADAYGHRILEAAPAPGALAFLRRCRERGVACRVVSHKTPRAAADPDADLHAAALAFLEAHGFLDAAHTGLEPEHVFFEPTRADKLARISSLGCTHCIDDLEELFREPGFPDGVARLLYTPAARPPCPHADFQGGWPAITEHLLP